MFHLLRSKFFVTTPLVNALYLIDVSSYNLQMDVALKKSKQGVKEAYLWYCRLGHVGDGSCIKMHTWEHLIMNHLQHVNLALWVNYPSLHS